MPFRSAPRRSAFRVTAVGSDDSDPTSRALVRLYRDKGAARRCAQHFRTLYPWVTYHVEKAPHVELGRAHDDPPAAVARWYSRRSANW